MRERARQSERQRKPSSLQHRKGIEGQSARCACASVTEQVAKARELTWGTRECRAVEAHRDSMPEHILS
eukprot:4451820-Pleurochrysis_carterae.AAC.1